MDDFPTLAPVVPSRTDLIQATLGSRQILRLRQGALASGLTRPIDVEDLPLSTCSVQQFASLLLLSERAREQILHKARAQGFNSLQGKDGKKATERRAGGQFLAVERGHERLRPGQHRLIESFQSALAADRVAEEHSEKVDDLVASEAATSKAHLLAYPFQNFLPGQVVS
jgi:hypothetical protein